jgi:hypothetical protein
MSSQDVIPDRAQLRRTATRRTRRGWLLLAALAVLALVVTPVVVLLVNGRPPGADVALAFVPAVVTVAVGAPVAWWIHRRRREPELIAGADRGTRRAVWRALRTGHAPDARIDALAREAADRNVRNSWVLVLYAILLLLQLGLLTLKVTDGEGFGETALSALTAACWAAALAVSWVMRNRSRRYLQGTGLHYRT